MSSIEDEVKLLRKEIDELKYRSVFFANFDQVSKLSSDAALLNGANTYTGSNTFNGTVRFNGPVYGIDIQNGSCLVSNASIVNGTNVTFDSSSGFGDNNGLELTQNNLYSISITLHSELNLPIGSYTAIIPTSNGVDVPELLPIVLPTGNGTVSTTQIYNANSDMNIEFNYSTDSIVPIVGTWYMNVTAIRLGASLG